MNPPKSMKVVHKGSAVLIEQAILAIEDDYIYSGNFNSEDELLILCFFHNHPTHNQKLLNQIQAKFPNAKITGCGGAGQVHEDIIYDKHMIINFIKFSHSNQFELIECELSNKDSLQVGLELGKIITNSKSVSGVIIFSDGLNLDGDKFSEGLKSQLKITCPIVGGLAGDDANFKETFVISKCKIISKKLVAIVLKEHISMEVTAHGGWKRFGFEHVITKAEGNVIFEIDNRAALEFYKEYLGNESEKLPSSGLHFPLNVLDQNNLLVPKENVVRTLLAIDQEKKSLTFAGSIPLYAKIDLMKSTDKDLLAAAEENVKILLLSLDKISKKNINVFSLVISCVGRRLALGQKIEEELLGFKDLPGKVYQSGFYSYGELSSTQNSKCRLQNQTLTQAIFWEDSDD